MEKTMRTVSEVMEGAAIAFTDRNYDEAIERLEWARSVIAALIEDVAASRE